MAAQSAGLVPMWGERRTAEHSPRIERSGRGEPNSERQNLTPLEDDADFREIDSSQSDNTYYDAKRIRAGHHNNNGERRNLDELAIALKISKEREVIF